jgi:protein-disulfide isomerase
MPTNSQSGRPSGRQTPATPPPTTRRSARQQRIASREANRQLARAGTRGSSGGNNSFLLYTLAAVAIAVVVIAAAFILTNQKSGPSSQLGAPNAPAGSMVTPLTIPMDGRTLGNANAAVTIDLWEDFQCTNCWTFTHDMEPKIVANYVLTGRAKIVFHDFIVIDGNVGGTESADAANAGLCANDQGKFWPYHDWLFANQYQEGSGAFTKDRLKSIFSAMNDATGKTLDTAKFNTCVDSGSHDADVKKEQSSLPSGVTGTPSIIVNGTLLASYDYATTAAAIDKILGISPSPSISATATPTPVVTAAPSVVPSISPVPSPKAS